MNTSGTYYGNISHNELDTQTNVFAAVPGSLITFEENEYGYFRMISAWSYAGFGANAAQFQLVNTGGFFNLWYSIQLLQTDGVSQLGIVSGLFNSTFIPLAATWTVNTGLTIVEGYYQVDIGLGPASLELQAAQVAASAVDLAVYGSTAWKLILK